MKQGYDLLIDPIFPETELHKRTAIMYVSDDSCIASENVLRLNIP